MRAPAGAPNLGVYVKAVPLLVRNPSIVVVPLLMAVLAVLIGRTFSPDAGLIGMATSGLAGLIVLLLQLFGLAAACTIADEAWRRGRASFDSAWTDVQRRAGEILYAAFGVTFIMVIAQFTATLFGAWVALALMALAWIFLIWTIPAAAVGGAPGAAAIQISIDRVRADPVPALIAAVVAVALIEFLAPFVALMISLRLGDAFGSGAVIGSLINALLQAIAISYVALVITKTYTDSAFGRRW